MLHSRVYIAGVHFVVAQCAPSSAHVRVSPSNRVNVDPRPPPPPCHTLKQQAVYGFTQFRNSSAILTWMRVYIFF